jgi:hypothetical protein
MVPFVSPVVEGILGIEGLAGVTNTSSRNKRGGMSKRLQGSLSVQHYF